MHAGRNHHQKFERKFDTEVPLHFLCSSIQALCALAILAFQIVLTITQTCPFQTAIGYWSFPFLILAPITVGVFILQRNLLWCCLLILGHIASTLFATTIIIICFLVLIEQLGASCTTSNDYSFALNISLIAVSICLKIFLYGEILLVYTIARSNQQITISFHKDYYDIVLANPRSRIWKSLRVELDDFDDIDV